MARANQSVRLVFCAQDMNYRRPVMAKGMGKGRNVGHQGIGRAGPNAPDESDIANEVQGKNTLQGNDQKNVRNERRAYPDQPAPPRKEGG
jgi:hypothetical protein